MPQPSITHPERRRSLARQVVDAKVTAKTVAFSMISSSVLLAGIAAATPVCAASPEGPRQGFYESHGAQSMTGTEAIVVQGVLRKRSTVGYRSPFVLMTEDAREFEIRESDLVTREQLEKLIGENVEITGRRVVIPSGKAPPGSEAESRFIGGAIPRLEYIETKGVRSVRRSNGPQ